MATISSFFMSFLSRMLKNALDGRVNRPTNPGLFAVGPGLDNHLSFD